MKVYIALTVLFALLARTESRTHLGYQNVTSSQPGVSENSSQPGETVTPSSQPGETVTPSSQPGETVTPSSQPGETVTPSSQPGETVTPSSQPGETENSSSQPGETVTPSSQPGETENSSSQPGETVTPSSQLTSQSVSSSPPGEKKRENVMASVEMTEADKAYIVNRHNELRRGVKPTASNMLKMSWSVVAAANAQRWADKCTLDHSPSQSRKLSRAIGCGENIAMGHSHTESSWADKIQMWYDEVKDWKHGEGSVNGKTVGHFTQVVWYRSNQIGCAVAHCPDAKYKYFYVCQYCTPGNYQYTHPYKAGPACGDCPNDCDDKLCTNPCPYQDKWNNCADLGKWGCKGDKCEASCKCTSDEII